MGYGSHTLSFLIKLNWLTFGFTSWDDVYNPAAWLFGLVQIICMITMTLYLLDFYTAPHLYDNSTGVQMFCVLGKDAPNPLATFVGRV